MVALQLCHAGAHALEGASVRGQNQTVVGQGGLHLCQGLQEPGQRVGLGRPLRLAEQARHRAEPGCSGAGGCAACHTLTPSDGNRAGPTLHGIFGRRIASAPGYAYSEAFRTMDIVWTKETVAKLFEIGPNAYTPGTKMPEQTISSAEDRQALVDWLEKVTK